VTLIARADGVLSVVMTTASTLAAVWLLPLFIELLASRYVAVDGWKLLGDVLQVVLLPVALGVGLKRSQSTLSRRLAPVMPPLAVLVIVLIVASIVGSQRQVLLEQGALLLHGGGFLLGWLIPALLGQLQPVCRTVSIEVGMQNSILAVVLARSGFAVSALTALPGAISAVVHAARGSVLASWWRRTQGGKD
jgi:bile acid:Na+ symporter, BASS family